MQMLFTCVVLAGLVWAPSVAAACDTGTADGLAGCIDEARYAADLKAIGSAPRPMESASLKDARKHCYAALQAAGFEARRHIVDKDEPVINVVGYRKGTDPTRPAVVVGAHVDSVRDCNGANDNASGVAGVLEMARVLGQTKHAADLYMVCFDAEETGHRGSQRWVDMARGQSRAIALAIIFEQIGNRLTQPGTQAPPPAWFAAAFPEAAALMKAAELRGDFAMFIHDSKAPMPGFAQVEKAAGVRLLRGVLQRKADGALEHFNRSLGLSDHKPFWMAGYSALYITDTGPFRKSGFHCMIQPDDIGGVDTAFAAGIVRGATRVAAESLGIH